MKRRTVIRVLVGFAGFIAVGGVLVRSDPLLRTIIFDDCPLDQHWEYAVPGDGRYSLTYYQRDCGFIVVPYQEGVFAERSRFPWPWPEREYIFLYPSDAYNVNIIPIGPNSVTISVEEVDAVFHAETSWGTLKIDYNIGNIRNRQPTDPPTAGLSWAEKHRLLQDRARELGTQSK